MSAAHSLKVEISPPVVDGSHAVCRVVPFVSIVGAGFTPTESDRAAWIAREFPASPMHRGVRDRFLSRVAVVADEQSCWLWTGGVTSRKPGARDGYGMVDVRDGDRLRHVGAHRVAHEMATGSTVPANRDVMHACDVPRCVRPSHLSIGSRADNMGGSS